MCKRDSLLWIFRVMVNEKNRKGKMESICKFCTNISFEFGKISAHFTEILLAFHRNFNKLYRKHLIAFHSPLMRNQKLSNFKHEYPHSTSVCVEHRRPNPFVAKFCNSFDSPRNVFNISRDNINLQLTWHLPHSIEEVLIWQKIFFLFFHNSFFCVCPQSIHNLTERDLTRSEKSTEALLMSLIQFSLSSFDDDANIN